LNTVEQKLLEFIGERRTLLQLVGSSTPKQIPVYQLTRANRSIG
jgi:hypothetical protein